MLGPSISKSDIDLIQKLDTVLYPQTMKGLISVEEEQEFKALQRKLKHISDHIKNNYDSAFGNFTSERSKGNPVGRSGRLRRVWSGVYKGNINKQYSAQVSIVVNTQLGCLNVGFYFGRAAAINYAANERARLEDQLKKLGALLYTRLQDNQILKDKFTALIDHGFKCEVKNKRYTADEWLSAIAIDPTYSSITADVYPNENGQIDYSTIDTYIAMVMPLIGTLPENIDQIKAPIKLVKPLTPEQRAKQAEIRTLIGIAGEEFVLKSEGERLKSLKLKNLNPVHQSMISDSFHYDILSYDENGKQVFIEVKTTTRLKREIFAKTFYMSNNEYQFFKTNKEAYKLYRVFDIYGKPEFEIINLDELEPYIDTYKIITT